MFVLLPASNRTEKVMFGLSIFTWTITFALFLMPLITCGTNFGLRDVISKCGRTNSMLRDDFIAFYLAIAIFFTLATLMRAFILYYKLCGTLRPLLNSLLFWSIGFMTLSSIAASLCMILMALVPDEAFYRDTHNHITQAGIVFFATYVAMETIFKMWRLVSLLTGHSEPTPFIARIDSAGKVTDLKPKTRYYLSAFFLIVSMVWELAFLITGISLLIAFYADAGVMLEWAGFGCVVAALAPLTFDNVCANHIKDANAITDTNYTLLDDSNAKNSN